MKKHLFIKLSLLLLLVIWNAHVWAVTYNPSGVAQQTMQSQQVMQTGGAYNGTVYEPFSNTTPSEASNPAKAPSGPRRAYDSEGNWIPDAPDIETAGDTGNSNESPIGEPWVMLLMALAFGGWIAAKQVRKKIIKQENNTQNKSTMKGQKFIAILTMLLTFGVGQIWAERWVSSCNIQYYTHNGIEQTHDGWYNEGDGINIASNDVTLEFGTLTQFYFKKAWAKGSHNDNWGCNGNQMKYGFEGNESEYNLDYTHNTDNPRYYEFPISQYDVISNAPNNPGQNTMRIYFNLNYNATGSRQSKWLYINFTIPGFTTTSTSQAFDNTFIDGTNSKTISFGQHYGTALTTSNCAITGTNASDFSVTSISETGVTVQFYPRAAGSKLATLTITDAHSKTCTITLTGKTKYTVTYNKGDNGTGDNKTADKVYGTNLILAGSGYFTRTGYTQTAWNENSDGESGTSYELNDTYSTDAAITLYPTWSPTQYTITFDKQSGSGGTNSATVHYTQNDFSVSPVVAPTRTGYTFGGYYSGTNGSGEEIVNANGNWVDPASAGTYLDASGNWNYAGNLTVYAKWTPITYAVVFNGNGSTDGSMANQNFTYDVAQNLTANVYEKDGYYMTGWATTAEGAKVYDDGQSVSNLRNTSGNFDLYAKWAQSELTNLTFTPSSPAPEGDVAITPVFDHEPTGTTVICYELHSNSTATAPVSGATFAEGGDSKVHFNAPSASGTYYVKATFRAGGSCSGTVLNTIVVPIVISSDHTVTVRYMCDGVAIHAPSEVVVPAGGTLAITALTGDDVFGYSFDSWALGDGINQESVAGGTITISAFFNGVLTANYTKKNIIYFKNTLRWENVYVNLYTQDYWDSGTRGSGNSNNTYTRNVLMSQVPGTTDIFYYEYTNITTYVSFTSSSQNGSDNFWGSGDGINVVYPTRPDATSTNDVNCGFSAGAPMFVPVTGQTGQVRNEGNKGKANYFDKGYWRKYEPATGKTGYYLEVFNKPTSDGRETLYRIDMTDASTAGDIFEATIDLEAGKNYGIKVLRDNDFGYTNTSTSQMALVESGTYTELSKQSASNWRAVDMQSTTAGNYTFKLTCGSDNGKLKIAVKKPAAANDYRVVYQDANHNTDRKQRFSRTITKKANADDIVSFFIDKGNSEAMKFQYISNIVGSTVTWADAGSINLSSFSDVITQDGVYNFYVHQDESGNISVTKVEPYTGDFYIRTDAVGGTKWADYQNAAHVMAYSEYAKDNSGYSHYWMKHLIGTDNVNVKFVVANDYSAWISDTVIQQSPEVARIDANGINTGDVSIRFSYNSATNEAKRTYLANSTAPDFLVLKNNATSGNFTDENGTDKAKVDIKFVDHENYIYDIIAKVNPSAKVRIKVYAHYYETDQSLIGTDVLSTFTDANSKLLLDGTGSTLQTIRILYDFKTNRIVSAWQAAGTTTGKLKIDADLMIVREHQGAAQNIILKPYIEIGKPDVPGEIVTNKRIYAVMRFNRWILNNLDHPEDKEADHAKTEGVDQYTNHHHPLEPRYQLPTYERNLYYISFPFDVNVSDIFGFGTYGTHYAIQRYDGIGRAKNGYWVDSDPNWKWVPPTGKLNAYEGYVLSLSLSNMYVTNTNVWANNCSEVELYFPSAEEKFTIDTRNVTIAAINGKDSEYRCTIDRGTPDGDRRIKDSYWRCIGVPSFANYETALTSDGSTTINWQPASADEIADGSIPFIYNINWNDKSLTAYEGSTFPFKAMHSYLVQYGGGIHWSNVVVSSPASVVARKRNENTSEHTYCLKLMQGDTFGDQTFVRMTDKEGVTSGFDFDQDLWKQKFANRANIYTFIGYEQVAGNSMPMSEQTTVVPVGVQIAADGEYTFVMPEGTEGVGVVLIDNIAGTRTNLALTDYTVNLTAGTYDERFYLEISPIVQSPTGIEQTGSDSKDGVRKVMVDGILYIVKDGRIYDATGNRVQ